MTKRQAQKEFTQWYRGYRERAGLPVHRPGHQPVTLEDRQTKRRAWGLFVRELYLGFRIEWHQWHNWAVVLSGNPY